MCVCVNRKRVGGKLAAANTQLEQAAALSLFRLQLQLQLRQRQWRCANTTRHYGGRRGGGGGGGGSGRGSRKCLLDTCECVVCRRCRSRQAAAAKLGGGVCVLSQAPLAQRASLQSTSRQLSIGGGGGGCELPAEELILSKRAPHVQARRSCWAPPGFVLIGRTHSLAFSPLTLVMSTRCIHLFCLHSRKLVRGSRKRCTCD